MLMLMLMLAFGADEWNRRTEKNDDDDERRSVYILLGSTHNSEQTSRATDARKNVKNKWSKKVQGRETGNNTRAGREREEEEPK